MKIMFVSEILMGVNVDSAEEEREDQRKIENPSELGSQWNKGRFLFNWHVLICKNLVCT